MKKIFKLEGLGCANCANKIQEGVAKLENIKSVTVNFITTKMTLEFDGENFDKTFEEIKNIVHSFEPDVNIVKA